MRTVTALATGWVLLYPPRGMSQLGLLDSFCARLLSFFWPFWRLPSDCLGFFLPAALGCNHAIRGMKEAYKYFCFFLNTIFEPLSLGQFIHHSSSNPSLSSSNA